MDVENEASNFDILLSSQSKNITYKIDSNFLTLNMCISSIDSINNVMWWPSYGELRRNLDIKDDKDVASYLHDVMIIRSNLDINICEDGGCHALQRHAALPSSADG